MKKIIMTTALLAGAFMTTSVASAAALDQSGSFAQGTAVTNAECVLLGSSVKPNLSSSVHAGYRCVEASGVIEVGSCHEGGSRAPKVTDCIETTDPVTSTKSWNDASCKVSTDTFELVERRYYSMSSDGGSVTPSSLGAGSACDDAAVKKNIAL